MAEHLKVKGLDKRLRTLVVIGGKLTVTDNLGVDDSTMLRI